MKKNTLVASLILFALPLGLLAGELRIVIAPQSAILTAEGYIRLDVYVYNDGGITTSAPAPEAEFSVSWTLRDLDNIRPLREDSHSVFGTDTLKKHVLAPHAAIRCEVGDRILAEPGDVLELYITVDQTDKRGKTKTLRSNSVMFFRPKLG